MPKLLTAPFQNPSYPQDQDMTPDEMAEAARAASMARAQSPNPLTCVIEGVWSSVDQFHAHPFNECMDYRHNNVIADGAPWIYWQLLDGPLIGPATPIPDLPGGIRDWVSRARVEPPKPLPPVIPVEEEEPVLVLTTIFDTPGQFGVYSTPENCVKLEVQMVGGGAGGAGGGQTGASWGFQGGDTTFGTTIAGGGRPIIAHAYATGPFQAWNTPGGMGTAGGESVGTTEGIGAAGGTGGASFYGQGGGGVYQADGQLAEVWGAGGGGGGVDGTVVAAAGRGGGAGAFAFLRIQGLSIAPNFTFSVGAGGKRGPQGVGGHYGGDGAGGRIIIEAYISTPPVTPT